MYKNINIALKEALNEVSSDMFHRAIDLSKERGTERRTNKLGSLFYHKFIGLPLFNGVISDVSVTNPQQGSYKSVVISIRFTVDGKPKEKYVYYDVINDSYDLDFSIVRKDAVILSKIAKRINPDTKYNNVTLHFDIVGY